jgi:hypothetical protein
MRAFIRAMLQVRISPDAQPIDEKAFVRAFLRCLRSIRAKYQDKEVPSMPPQTYDPETHEPAPQAAKRCGHSLAWLYVKIKLGTIRGVRVGGRWFVLSEDVNKLLAHTPHPVS